jgi:hypothetical protein
MPKEAAIPANPAHVDGSFSLSTRNFIVFLLLVL